MKRTLACIVCGLLEKNKRKQFTSHEIAEMIVKTEPDFVAKKTKRTQKTDKELVWQLMSEIGAQYLKMRRMNVVKTADRPAKYFYQKPAKPAEETKPAKEAKVAKTAKKTKAVAAKAK